jgi:ADP-ribose pyrophosphatase
MGMDKFNIILLAIIFDPAKRKILIAKRGDEDGDIKNLIWQFPEGRLRYGNDVDEILERKIKKKTGLNIKNLGAVSSKVYPEKEDLLAIYFLCEVIGGEIKPADDFVELKWVKPEKLENYFTTSFHPHMKEYVLNLK